MKTCSCTAHYDLAAWQRLPFVGIQAFDPNDRIDIRNCACRSSIAVDLPPGVSVCTGCGVWLGTGDVKVAAEGEPIFCVPCARACGLITSFVRRSAA
jgi:hypothetical protein